MQFQVSKTMGTSVSLVGGGLTIAGGILTIATAGVATPVLIAGIHTINRILHEQQNSQFKITKTRHPLVSKSCSQYLIMNIVDVILSTPTF